MQNKIKTFPEIKNELAKSIDYNTVGMKFDSWIHFQSHCEMEDLFNFYSDTLEEAAELYASEENRKKDEPKQSDQVSVENLKALVYGKELNTYQRGLAVQEFEKHKSCG